MRLRLRVPAVLLAVFILISGSAYGQNLFRMKSYSSPIEVLTQDEFAASFGDNPDIPRTDEAVIALAERLYPSLAFKAQTPVRTKDTADWCGEHDVGVLFAALQNPEISEVTRKIVDDIIDAAIPPLPKSTVSPSGHFKIYYTTNDANPLHNVTDAQITSVASLLDSYWNQYVNNFKTPKYKLVNGEKRIDVKVYYIDADTLGQTSSGWDHIELNSALAVSNSCDSATTSAHELFHRVQYAYGYVSGTANMEWIVEGTAVWSQKYTNQSLRDYMAWMNEGLGSPGTALITEKHYDAAHYWVYLSEQAGSSAIKQVWAKYQANGKKAKEAVGSVTTALLGLNFDKYTAKWTKTNFIKDLKNAITGGYDYDENNVTKTSCGVAYGPLRKVPVTAGTINPNSSFTQNGNVKPYGAKYHVFTLSNTLKNLAVNFKGTGSFELAFIGIKNDEWKSITNKTLTKYNFAKTLTAGQWDKLAVVVMGTSTGGNYSLKIVCITGTWTDSYGKTWVLKENGTSITGTRDSTPVGCGINNVTGTYNAPNIVLDTDAPSTCCKVRWEGTVTDCKTIAGTWYHTGGASGCSYSGSFSMTKNDSESSSSDATMGGGQDPTCTSCRKK